MGRETPHPQHHCPFTRPVSPCTSRGTDTRLLSHVLAFCLTGFCMSVSSTDWLALRAGTSPPQNPGLVTDIVPWGSGQRAQQVPLPDWPKVSAALSQLSWPSAFSPSWRLMVTGLFCRGPLGCRTPCDPGGWGFSAHAGTGGHKGRRCVQSPGLAGEWWTISLPLLAAEDRNCCSRMPAWAWNICKGSKQDWEQGCL